MVKAILAGKKTQTRRIIDVPATHNFSGWVIESTCRKDEGKASFSIGSGPRMRDGRYKPCPFGKVGDTLWVREAFTPDPDADSSHWHDKDSLHTYFSWSGCGSKLSELPKAFQTADQCIYRATFGDDLLYKPSIHMPRWAARIFLKVIGIRVERLQDISEADAKAEGFDHSESEAAMAAGWYEKPRKAFRRTIESLYGDDTWESNPWVWVVEFEVMHTAP